MLDEQPVRGGEAIKDGLTVVEDVDRNGVFVDAIRLAVPVVQDVEPLVARRAIERPDDAIEREGIRYASLPVMVAMKASALSKRRLG